MRALHACSRIALCVICVLCINSCASQDKAEKKTVTSSPEAPTYSSTRLTPVSYVDILQTLPEALKVKEAITSARVACDAMFSRGIHAPFKRTPASLWGTKDQWKHACDRIASLTSEEALSHVYGDLFCPYAVAQKKDGLFTGYYLPQISVSDTRTDTHTTPVYGLPKGHTSKKRFPSRASIEKNGLKNAPIIAWTNDPIALFFLHVQGSGYGRYADGSMITLAFAGKNNHPYTSVGAVMIKRKHMKRADMNGHSLKKALYAMKNDAMSVLHENASYIFFSKQEGTQVKGAAGARLVPQHAIAVDPAYMPYYLPVLLATRTTQDGNSFTDFTRFVHSLDTGSAIKGEKRADIFFGGGEEAEQTAYRQQFDGEMIIFLPRGSRERCQTSSDNASLTPVGRL